MWDPGWDSGRVGEKVHTKKTGMKYEVQLIIMYH
jgi:hypothetical protein